MWPRSWSRIHWPQPGATAPVASGFRFPADRWARTVCGIAAAFHHRRLCRDHLLSSLTPSYLPRVFAALLIILGGFLLGNSLSRATLLAAVNANAPAPRATRLEVELLIGILSFAMALEQLQIAKSIVLAAFTITFGAVMLGLVIAVGVGGKEAVRRVLERQLEPRDEVGGRDETSPP